jgi:hypothetical protein
MNFETAKPQVLTGDNAAIVTNKQATPDAQMVVRTPSESHECL